MRKISKKFASAVTAIAMTLSFNLVSFAGSHVYVTPSVTVEQTATTTTTPAPLVPAAYREDNGIVCTPEEQILEAVNAIRAEAGLESLSYDYAMQPAAKIRASEITTKFSHIRPDGSEWWEADPDLLYGENLSQGYSIDEVVAAWSASPIHHANLVNPEFTTMAVGITVGQDGLIYIAQEFGID